MKTSTFITFVTLLTAFLPFSARAEETTDPKPPRTSRLLALHLNTSLATEIEKNVQDKTFHLPVSIKDYPIALNCLYRFSAELIFEFKIDHIEFDTIGAYKPGRPLISLLLSVPKLMTKGHFSLSSADPAPQCAYALKTDSLTIPIENLVLTVLVEPQVKDGGLNLTFYNDMFPQIPTLAADKIQYPQDPQLEILLNRLFDAMRRPIFRLVGQMVQDVLSGRLSGYFGTITWEEAQPLQNIIESDVFFKPIIYEKGPFEVRSNNQDIDLSHYFYRRALHPLQPFAVEDNAVSFFFNALIDYTPDPLEYSTGRGKPELPSSNQTLPTSLFDQRDTHAALAVSNALVNDILSTIYRDGLLNLTAFIKVGTYFKDFISEKLPNDIRTYLQIDPQKPPNIWYDAKRVSITVDNISVKIGTHLEDRYLPSFTVNANASIDSQLGLNPENNNVSLTIKKKGVTLHFTPADQTMTQDQLSLFEALFADIFTDYFDKHPNLALFPPIINLKTFNLSISSIDIKDEYILMYLNLNLLKKDFLPLDKNGVVSLAPLLYENGQFAFGNGQGKEKR